MMNYEITNEQRKYFGIDPIQNHWDRVIFTGDTHHPVSILYFDKDTIKRYIVSTQKQYFERQYDEPTKERSILLPKTAKGKEKKLSTSVLEQRQPTGVYLNVGNGNLKIGNYTSQTTFYSSSWENDEPSLKTIPEIINDFIFSSPENHLAEIEKYKNLKRKNIKFKAGDYFCFKLNRTHYGFGRILLDVGKTRKKKLIDDKHGLSLFMGLPVFIELFAFKSQSKTMDIATLDKQPKLPSDVMMDNLFLYGEYEIIGHREIKNEEFDFPISYGRSIGQRKTVFLQWGLIHKELPQEMYAKHISTDEIPPTQNPYGYYSIGFRPFYGCTEVMKTIGNNGKFDFDKVNHYKAKWDLRNPKNKAIKEELFKTFGLDANKSYYENSKLTKTKSPSEIIGEL